MCKYKKMNNKLEGIRGALKQRIGSFSEISEATGFSVAYVSLVMKGERINPRILEVATKLATTATKQQAEMKTLLNN
jgi:hypothetical protein